jgi:serine/threonine-protein phosphatase 4 regulatory subunit 1
MSSKQSKEKIQQVN